MIYVGADVGGSEASDSALLKLIELLPDITYGKEGSVGSLDVVFHLPGSVYRPDFTGVRTGRFSRPEAMLQIQVSVPYEVMREHGAARLFLSPSLREGLTLGQERFRRAGIGYPYTAYLRRLRAFGY